MDKFTSLWSNHPAKAHVCDASVFSNQCAMRMGVALRRSGVSLVGLKTCVDYSSKFKTHKPGHVRSSQELANYFYRKPKAHGLGAASFKVYTGSIQANLGELKDGKGMLFIMNGWGRTDHIDVWKGNGTTGVLKGGDSSYFGAGTHVWFWGFA